MYYPQVFCCNFFQISEGDKTMSQKNNQKKTNAKRIGIKSVLIHGKDRLTITTFGKGNDAEVALTTDTKGNEIKDKLPTKVGGGQVHTIVPEIDVKGRDYQGNLLDVVLANPAEHAGEDYLKLKSQLEIEFFGKEFPNDNIRIQIIYNILDIQKILGLYITDIIYTIANLQDLPVDVLGPSLSDTKFNTENILEKMNPYFTFFGDVFQTNVPKSIKENGIVINQAEINEAKAEKKKDSERQKNSLRILGAIRQIATHYKDTNILLQGDSQIKKRLKNGFKVEWEAIEKNWLSRINKVNNDFVTNSALNLKIIFDILKPNDEIKRKIAKEYYEFSILKNGKNIGVNMKKIRELIFKNYFHEVTKEHSSYRQKINHITDFFLFKQYNGTPTIDKWVVKLRQTTDEDAKDTHYEAFAKDAAMILGSTTTNGKIQKLVNALSNYFTDKPKKEPSLDPGLITDVQLHAEETTSLSKLLAFLCHFLEGKEINELLTAYIHKFENIQTFINVLKKLDENISFSDKYALFNENNNQCAKQIADELRILASIGKMKPNLEAAKRQLYKAAIETLGVPDNSDKLSDEWSCASINGAPRCK
jgi:hypothetical protein